MGLLDWLTDGSLFGGSSSGGTPPVQMTGTDAAPLNSYMKGYDSMYASGPGPTPTPPMPPMPTDTPAASAPDTLTPPPDATGGLSGAVPIPQPRPAAADAAPPIPAPAAPPPAAPPTAIAAPTPSPAIPAGPPMSIAPDAAAPLAPPAPADGGGFMGRFRSAIGGGLGAGLTAAGNSTGKSPFQALASGAGATMTGANEEEHKNTKDAQGYLTAAIAAKRANDTAGYNTNIMQFHLAKLKSEQEQAASESAAKTAQGNKNDSPTQLYLGVQRLLNNDPQVNGALEGLKAAQKEGTPQDVATAQARYEQVSKEREAYHMANVGLHPQTAAEIAKQPGNSQANPIDAGQAGVTKDNITKKLQPGQYYKNPSDGKIYQFKGTTPDVGSAPSAKTSSLKNDKGPPTSDQLKMRELVEGAE